MRNRDYQHPSLPSFAQLAEALCRAIANTDALRPAAQLVSIHRLLAQVYAAALQLPSTSTLFEDSPETEESQDADEAETEPEFGPAATPEPASVSLDNLAEYLDQRRYYREIFDPYEDAPKDEVFGDLFDDLQDIHRDLSRGLVHWHEGDGGRALWEWRFGLETHWGEHATSALRALFALCAWNDYPWPTA
jgi:hypothetical protein